MNIDEFCSQFGSDAHNIDKVAMQWHVDEIDRMLCKLDDDVIGNAMIVGDALHGDGLRDQIPRELRDAFANLMTEKADSYKEMRRILSDKIRDGDGGFLSFDDPRVQGFVSKLKGQIGENTFQRHAGAAAHLAQSGSQEGWDIAVTQPDGMHDYVQVKLYASPSGVVSKMREVQQKVANGLIEGCDGETVERIDFAVPENIAEHVRRLADRYPELAGIEVRSIPISTDAAADFVKEGLSNVGPEQLSHFFDELLFGAVAAGSMHTLVNGFLWYKGAKEFSDAFADAAATTTLSAAGIGVGLLAESLLNAAALASVVGIGSRLFLSRFARSRWSFADFLEQSIASSDIQISALQRLGGCELTTTKM